MNRGGTAVISQSYTSEPMPLAANVDPKASQEILSQQLQGVPVCHTVNPVLPQLLTAIQPAPIMLPATTQGDYIQMGASGYIHGIPMLPAAYRGDLTGVTAPSGPVSTGSEPKLADTSGPTNTLRGQNPIVQALPGIHSQPKMETLQKEERGHEEPEAKRMKVEG